MHTLVCEPASRSLLVGVGGDATPQQIDFDGWTRGAAIGVTKLEGQLGGKTRPFDADRPPPPRSSRPRTKPSYRPSPRRKVASPWPRRRFTPWQLHQTRSTERRPRGRLGVTQLASKLHFPERVRPGA